MGEEAIMHYMILLYLFIKVLGWPCIQNLDFDSHGSDIIRFEHVVWSQQQAGCAVHQAGQLIYKVQSTGTYPIPGIRHTQASCQWLLTEASPTHPILYMKMPYSMPAGMLLPSLWW